MDVDKLIKSLEVEIKQTQTGVEQINSLERLKEVALIYNGEDKVIPFSDIVSKIKLSREEEKILSGWGGLDDILGGFRFQQVVAVSALTKSGKTSFLMDLTTRIQDYHPLWFPFEESAEELIRKYIERGEEPPVAFTPEVQKANSIEWIESKVIESIAKFNTRVVFIDHLDYIVPFTSEQHHLAISRTMRDLKGLAKKWNIIIFLIVHLQKAKMDTQPTLEDFRGSSSIGQEVDTAILLWREMKREQGQVVITDNVNVSVQANRRTGKTGNVKMKYVNGKFLEEDWEQTNYPSGIDAF